MLDRIEALKDEAKEGDVSVAEPYNGVVATILERFQRAKDDRLTHEQRWLRAVRNYRGIYGPDMVFKDTEKSRVFVKITKTKTLAAYGQLLEVLFAGGKFPLSINPTEKPEGIAEVAHLAMSGEQPDDSGQVEDLYGFAGDGQELPPGATYSSLLGGLAEKYGNVPLVEGPAPDKTKSPELYPAEESAKAMDKLVHDQLGEAKAENALRHTLFEMALLGTGILKGPSSLKKTYHKWVPTEDGNVYQPVEKLVPTVEPVSIWNFYPDPSAIDMDDVEWAVERHAYNRSQMRQLLKRPLFREEAVKAAIMYGPNYTEEWFENQLRDAQTTEVQTNRFEVLEYWGIMDKEFLVESGVALPSQFDDLDEIQINAWVCGNYLLRVVLNPFTPARLPYQVCPYEIHPYQFWGIGIPENMDDCQTVMNGHARMAIDNLALAGNLVFDIDETSLVAGQDYKVYPGKIFRRQGGTAGQSVFGIKFPNTAPENLAMFDKFRQLADEATGIPSYSHGATGVQSTTRTAAGMSMLMGAAALNIKTVVKNIDDFLLRPLGEALFAWNMQFNEDMPEIHGDLEVKARGTASLLQKEVKSQRLLTFLQLTANPAIAPFIKLHTLVKEIAESLDVDPEKIINDPDEAMLQAQIIGAAGGVQGTDSPSVDPTGAGGANIGVGGAPKPGEQGFSGTTPPNAGTSANAEGSGAESANA